MPRQDVSVLQNYWSKLTFMKISLGRIGAEQQYCPAIALLPKPLNLFSIDFGALQYFLVRKLSTGKG
ncbi:hypothetical protein EK904_005841 [Melospiza melodia maxima]|nr:hypothetical protein EK904_005841 [Melospiza melodia maxima]